MGDGGRQKQRQHCGSWREAKSLNGRGRKWFAWMSCRKGRWTVWAHVGRKWTKSIFTLIVHRHRPEQREVRARFVVELNFSACFGQKRALCVASNMSGRRDDVSSSPVNWKNGAVLFRRRAARPHWTMSSACLCTLCLSFLMLLLLAYRGPSGVFKAPPANEAYIWLSFYTPEDIHRRLSALML